MHTFLFSPAFLTLVGSKQGDEAPEESLKKIHTWFVNMLNCSMDAIAWGDNTGVRYVHGKKNVTYKATGYHEVMLLEVSKRRKTP